MRERLIQIIKYKTGGSQKDFAALLGWTPQYLNRMLMPDGSIGLKPLVAILEKIPEIEARWLLLGEGSMFTNGAILRNVERLLQIEKFMPVMTPEEIRKIEQGHLDFTLADVQRWRELLDARQEAIDKRFREAYAKQKELCKNMK